MKGKNDDRSDGGHAGCCFDGEVVCCFAVVARCFAKWSISGTVEVRKYLPKVRIMYG